MFEKNSNLESYLNELNAALLPSERGLVKQYSERGKVFPTILKIGLPRVGGTLLTQWAQTACGFYLPSNFLSRFFQTPCTGALITKMLLHPELDYKNEFSDIQREIKLSSDIGKTSGVLSPHEFWYFWRSFLSLPDIPTSGSEFLANSRLNEFDETLSALKGIVSSPVFLKGHLVNFYLPEISQRLHNVVYFHLKRNLIDVAISLYKARIKWTGSEDIWFSHKPRQYGEIADLEPIYQVMGQVYFIEKEIEQHKGLLGERYFEATYQELCEQPEAVRNRFLSKVGNFSDEPLDKSLEGLRTDAFKYSTSQHSSLYSEFEQALDWFRQKYGPVEAER